MKQYRDESIAGGGFDYKEEKNVKGNFETSWKFFANSPFKVIPSVQESAVTCCEYLVDCPANIIPALYTVGSRGKGQVREPVWIIENIRKPRFAKDRVSDPDLHWIRIFGVPGSGSMSN